MLSESEAESQVYEDKNKVHDENQSTELTVNLKALNVIIMYE